MAMAMARMPWFGGRPRRRSALSTTLLLTTLALRVRAAAVGAVGAALASGDVCFRRCLDGSAAPFDRRYGCPSGATCASPGVGIDIDAAPCGDHAWKCMPQVGRALEQLDENGPPNRSSVDAELDAAVVVAELEAQRKEERSTGSLGIYAPKPMLSAKEPAELSADLHKISFDYHKDLFPLDLHHDGFTCLIAGVGLVIAASGGIGGGGILVPIYMLVLGFRTKHAIALSNFTIFGGAIANTVLNAGKRHPTEDRSLIDWDIIVMMEPLTIFGAVFGSLISKILPNMVLNVSLVCVLACMGRHTLTKGLKMWTVESVRKCSVNGTGASDMLSVASTSVEMARPDSLGPSVGNGDSDSESGRVPYIELHADGVTGEGLVGMNGSASKMPIGKETVQQKVAILTSCFVGVCILTVLKGGGNFPSPFGVACGSQGFWLLYFGAVPWVGAFALYFRNVLTAEYKEKVRRGHAFVVGEVQWDSGNAIRYPALCALSGLLAGLYGVGGGIVKGPLMLEMGVTPVVASASAATMILFTSAAASTSFVVFGLLHPSYGVFFFVIGFSCTLLGQYTVSRWVKRHQRQSPIVLSIGIVISISACLVALQSVVYAYDKSFLELVRLHGVCTSES